jgi:hypothetical protein
MVAGKEIVAPPAVGHAQVLNLMDALKAERGPAWADTRSAEEGAPSTLVEATTRKRKSS